METRRSSRLLARQQRNASSNSLRTSECKLQDNHSKELFCLCHQPEDGRFMICCDQCDKWYHGECVNVTSAAGQQMDMFICPTCTSVSSSQATTTNLPPSASFYPTDPCVEFQWGEIGGTTVVESINDAYEEVIHWKRNGFLVPSGRIGKEFLLELAKLYQAYADNTTLHSIALTACFIFQVLLLQKPHAKSKTKDHTTCLERRLALWHAGDFSALIKEGKCIQDHLQSAIHKTGHSNVARDLIV